MLAVLRQRQGSRFTSELGATCGWELNICFIPEYTLVDEIGQMSQLSVKMIEDRTEGKARVRTHHLSANEVFDVHGKGIIRSTDDGKNLQTTQCLTIPVEQLEAEYNLLCSTAPVRIGLSLRRDRRRLACCHACCWRACLLACLLAGLRACLPLCVCHSLCVSLRVCVPLGSHSVLVADLHRYASFCALAIRSARRHYRSLCLLCHPSKYQAN
jgi:hypothetical protein